MLSNAAISLRSRLPGASHGQTQPAASPDEIARQGFTLVELLTVIAIIGILSAITFGVVKGVNERAAISQAKAELNTLSQALEAFKRQYGDYPQAGPYTGSTTSTVPTSTVTTDGQPYRLFNALLGKLGPTMVPIDGKAFVSADNFSQATSNLPNTGDTAAVSNAFLDPWGRQYIYYYRSDSSQKWIGYTLLSAGPDGKLGITVSTTNGQVTISTAATAADNIYANR